MRQVKGVWGLGDGCLGAAEVKKLLSKLSPFTVNLIDSFHILRQVISGRSSGRSISNWDSSRVRPTSRTAISFLRDSVSVVLIDYSVLVGSYPMGGMRSVTGDTSADVATLAAEPGGPQLRAGGDVRIVRADGTDG